MKQPSCDKKLVVYYEILLPLVRKINKICEKYEIESVMFFRTDESDIDSENDSGEMMVSYGSAKMKRQRTFLYVIEMLCRMNRGAKV